MLQPTYVVSSNIDCVGYKLGTLYVRFRSGVTYSYEKVGFGTYAAMVKAESVGQFFHRFVRSKYKFTKLDHDPFTRLAA